MKALLTIENERQVNPNAQDLERIGRESAQMARAFATWREPARPVTRFEVPTDGVKSSSFGFRRYFNGQPRNPHSGMDIAGGEGTPILAPACTGASTSTTSASTPPSSSTDLNSHGENGNYALTAARSHSE